jgi:hypothetical protein
MEKHSEDKLLKMNKVQILELGRVFCGTPKGELSHLRSFRLKGAALIHDVH